MHDASKFSREEWGPYVDWHIRKKRDEETRARYEAAWAHHLEWNKHHWQWWEIVQPEGNGSRKMKRHALAMQEKYVREMVADWYAMGKEEGADGIVEYWEKGREFFGSKMHQETYVSVERIINELWDLGLIEKGTNHEAGKS